MFLYTFVCIVTKRHEETTIGLTAYTRQLLMTSHSHFLFPSMYYLFSHHLKLSILFVSACFLSLFLPSPTLFVNQVLSVSFLNLNLSCLFPLLLALGYGFRNILSDLSLFIPLTHVKNIKITLLVYVFLKTAS